MKKYKWGIIGLGKIAKKFASDLSLLLNAELYGVASRSVEKADLFAEQFSAKKSYGDYLSLIQDQEVEIIYIATPHAMHYENTISCLKHKKAVLCEKPMSLSLDRVEHMIELARINQTFLMEALWTAFMPHFQYVQELVRSEKYGKILNLKSDFGFRAAYNPDKRLFNKSLGGGSLMDVGIYPVFCALSLLGFPIDVQALASFSESKVDSQMAALLKYDDGVIANIESSLIHKTPTESILYFEEITVKMNARWHEPSSLTIYHENEEEVLTFDTKGLGYHYEAAEVMKCLDEGLLESEKMSWKKSINLAKLIDQIKKEVKLHY